MWLHAVMCGLFFNLISPWAQPVTRLSKHIDRKKRLKRLTYIVIWLMHSVELQGTPLVLFDTKGDVGTAYQV